MTRATALFLLFLAAASAQPAGDPFAFLRPTVDVDNDDRRQLDRGEPVVRILPAQGRQIAIVAAIRLSADGDRLVAWMRQIAALKKSAYVHAIGRFSDPPAPDDLAALDLDDDDLDDIRRCRPGDCALKLTGAEMRELQRAAVAADAAWKPALQDAFRGLVLGRVRAYLRTGGATLGRYEDNGNGSSFQTAFPLLMQRSEFLTRQLPQFAADLLSYPKRELPTESFLYWSKESVGGKPIVMVTHISIMRSREAGLPEALVAGKQLFATHYINAGLNVTSITRGSEGQRYLVYLNRSDVDVLGGLFGGLVRMIMGRRLRSEAAGVLQGLRERLDSGDPAMPARSPAASVRVPPAIHADAGVNACEASR